MPKYAGLLCGTMVLLLGCASEPAENAPPAAADAPPPVPIRPHPQNPRYFEYEGRPTVLVTSGEHYGALLNLDFDYIAYFDALAFAGLNHTRVFAGTYREVPGNFNIAKNTLAPKPDRYLAPWPRSETPGAADGGSKFDLNRWNDAYFARLKDLLIEAEKRGIVVELTLFCPFYNDTMWEVSPFNAKNNVNGVGDGPRVDALTLRSAALVEAQKAVTRKIVQELLEAPNIFYEICNEPYAHNLATDEWQREIAKTIVEADRAAPEPHLISQNYANGSKVIENPNPLVSLCNFHYSRPPDSVAMNYGLNVAIGMNETGFDGQGDATYRVQGWDFLMAGGALYNNLDYSFAVGHEGGDYEYDEATPGGGSETLRRQLGFLKRFLHKLPFIEMAPDATVVAQAPTGATTRALSKPGEVYAVYLHHGRVDAKAKPRYQVNRTIHRNASVGLNLPAGEYTVVWADPKSTAELLPSPYSHAGGVAELAPPPYMEDAVVVVWARR